jgi:Kef-type K+ transport system membrane component KefB
MRRVERGKGAVLSTDAIVTHVMAAIAVVVITAYVVGILFRKLHQPEVIGQLLAGIALGPSLLGRVADGAERAIFPVTIDPYLNVIAQTALVVFLLAVGYEIDLRALRRQSRAAVPAIALSTYLVPMALGVASVVLFRGSYLRVGEPQAGSAAFDIFVGIALSITAVPVMASLLAERGMTGWPAAVTALASAAVVDVLGWLTLGGVLILASVSSAGSRPWYETLLGLGVYFVVMLLVERVLLPRWWSSRSAVTNSKVPLALAVAFGSAWATSALGLHVIFGAFFAGLLMPRQADGTLDIDLLRPIEETGRLLLPVFFIVSGLSVNIGALHSQDLLLLALILVLAVVGKVLIGYCAARFTRMSGHDSLVVGILLDTRGLTELIALNVGLQFGLLHQRLYTLLVIMALITTTATYPLLSLIMSREPTKARQFPMSRGDAEATGNAVPKEATGLSDDTPDSNIPVK